MSELIVRQFQSSDADAVSSLWKELLPSSKPWNEPREVICQKRNRRDDLFFVAVLDGRLVATVLAGFDGVRGWIYSLAVDTGCRRQGIGRRMLMEAEQALLAEGCLKVNLQVRGSDASVVEFYCRCGYAVEMRTSLGKALLDVEAVADPVPTIRISSEIHLSQITRDDRRACLQHLNETPAFQQRTASIPYPYTELDADQWISNAMRQSLSRGRCRSWAIRQAEGELMGGIGLMGITSGEKAEVGYWLAQPYWGRGIMTTVLKQLCEFAFERYALQRIYAQAFSDNVASAQVLKKAGFAFEGTLRQHFFRDGHPLDVQFFGRTISQQDREPA